MIEALGFLTVLGNGRSPSRRAVPWFPVVGALVGLGVGLVWRGAVEWWSPAVAAALAVAADLALTGVLHVDGLVDSADGLLPHLDRERRLAVMAEPDVGAFGVAAAAVVLLLRWAALASMRADVWLVTGLWALSRTAMVGILDALPYARTEGLASAFRGRGGLVVVAAGAVASTAVVTVGIGTPGIVVVAGAWLAAGAIAALAQRRIGGFTGDVLGAAGVVAETVGLVIASAKW